MADATRIKLIICCRCGEPCVGPWWALSEGPVCQHCRGKERKEKRRRKRDSKKV